MAALISVDKGLLYPALRKAGVTLGPQRGPSPAQFQDAIDELNRLTGSLNCDQMFIYALDILTFPLVAGKKAYTIGKDPTGAVTADWNVPRPSGISAANIIRLSLRYKLAILTAQLWAAIVQQDIATTIPQGFYFDQAYPISTVYVWGQDTGGSQIELYTWHEVSKFGALTDTVELPNGYEDALVLNLACRLAPQFQKEVHPDVREQARISLMRLESINAPQPVLSLPEVGGHSGGGFNIYRG